MKNISNLVLDVWVDRGAVHSTDTRSMYTLDNGEKPSLGRLLSPATLARARYLDTNMLQIRAVIICKVASAYIVTAVNADTGPMQ